MIKLHDTIIILGFEIDRVCVEVWADIITSIGVFISLVAVAFEFCKYIKHEKNKRMQYLIKSVLKLIDIIYEQKNFIEHNLLSICILKSLQDYQLDNIGKVLSKEKYYNENNRIICNQLWISSNKYVLPHKYEKYQKRNRNIYRYISVDFQNYKWINSIENLYLNIQNFEDKISKTIKGYNDSTIFDIIKEYSTIKENEKGEKLCEINFGRVVQEIQISNVLKDIEEQHNALLKECDEIIKYLKDGIKSKTL